MINEHTRAIVLINPNNPTGAITPDQTTAQILSLAAEHDLVVISDEVYRELCFVKPPTSASVLTATAGAPVITLESLSKTHLIPGWRAGWMRFSHAEKMHELITAITRLASGRLCSPTPPQYAIKPALEGDRSFMNDFVGDLKVRRDFAVSRINEIDGLSSTTPEAAFYLMIKVDDMGGRTDEQFVLDMLEEVACWLSTDRDLVVSLERGTFVSSIWRMRSYSAKHSARFIVSWTLANACEVELRGNMSDAKWRDSVRGAKVKLQHPARSSREGAPHSKDRYPLRHAVKPPRHKPGRSTPDLHFL